MVAVVALAGACGLPSSSTPVTVPKAEVPYGLLDGPTPSPTPTTTPGVPLATATIYLADTQQTQQQLVAVPVEIPMSSLAPMVQTLLDRLAVGLSDRERSRGLVTDLGPGSTLVLRDVTDETATIEWKPTSPDPSPSKLPAAVGQIVLTASSVVGVDRVVFVRDGSPLTVPGPTGESTSDPLQAVDYRLLLAPGQPTLVRTMPVAGPAPTSAVPTTTSRG